MFVSAITVRTERYQTISITTHEKSKSIRFSENVMSETPAVRYECIIIYTSDRNQTYNIIIWRNKVINAAAYLMGNNVVHRQLTVLCTQVQTSVHPPKKCIIYL